MKAIFGAMLVLGIVLLAGSRAWKAQEEKRIAEEARRAGERAAAQTIMHEPADLKLRSTCFTPCAFRLDWPVEIDGAGYDLEVRPEGHQAYPFPGQGNDPFRLPEKEKVEYGTLIHLTSLHPEVKRVKIRIYERLR